MSKKTVKRAPARKVPVRKPLGRQSLWKAYWPWILGGVSLLLIAVLAGVAIRAARTAPRPAGQPETFANIRGTSYADGTTSALYPDPEKKGSGTRWLPSLGREDAPVTVIEFTDFNCSHCKDYVLNDLNGILQDYVATGKVRYVGHYYVFFPESQPPALAAMCAAEQGRYFEFSHAYFTALSAGFNNIELIAQRVSGLDQATFKECIRIAPYASALNDALKNAQKYGIQGTPSFWVNGQLIIGAQGLRRAIEDALAQSATPAP